MLPQLRPPAAEEKVDVGPENILATLNEQTKLLQATRDAIAGSEESSLAGQMKLLRTDTQDWRRQEQEARGILQYWNETRKFAEMSV